jgi:arylsulfatase A-like enzyme
MRNAFCFVAALLALVASASAAEPTPPPRPNIVVILADDMGFSDIGCYGSEIETPNIDALAKGGVKFSQFYNTARCCPTRASLLTGLYPHQAGVGHMTSHAFKDHPGYQNEVSKETPTIAEVLRPAKYATYMAGKWHITRKDSPKGPKDNWPIARGFDRYYGTIRGGGSYYDPATLTRDDKPITPASDTEYKPPEGKQFYYTDAIADNAARFVREHRERNADGKPFFMYVAFTSPHWPLHAPEETVAKYKGKYKDGYDAARAARFARQKEMGLIDAKAELSPAAWSWAQVENKPWEERCMEVYAAQVDRMDVGVGKIVAALKEAGQFENTLIFFLADNGGCAENMGRITHIDRIKAPATQPREPGQSQVEVFPKYTFDGRPVWDGQAVMPGPDDSYVAYGEGWANVSNTPFRMYKHFTHEGGISTPLIAHWPKGIQARAQWERQPGHLIDIMATCVELAGATNARMEGVSLTPAFRGESLKRQRPIFFEHEGNRAVRDGKWKLVAKSAKGAWELYDMEADRTEMHDLAASEPDRVKTMAAQWREWAKRANVLPLNPWRTASGE